MIRLPLLVTLSGLVLGTLEAQAVRALPRQATDTYAGSTNFSIPQASFRAQYWFAPDNLPAFYVLNQIGIRAARNTATLATTRTTEITVAGSAIAFGALSTNFAQNLGVSPITFFANRAVNFAAQAATTDPNLAAAWFPGDAPYLHFGSALVVDFRSGTGTTATTVPNDGFVMGATPTLHLFGRASCGGTLTASWNSGTLSYSASGLPSGAAVALNLGFDHVEDGGLALPQDLTPYGLTGCHLGVLPFASASLVASVGGVASLNLGIALPTGYLSLAAQAIHPLVQNPQLPADFGTTNVAISTLGATGLCNALFAAPSTATVAQQGPQAVSNSIVLLVR